MGDFYRERKYCDRCRSYVRFMMSVNRSYCTHCGSVVRLFCKAQRQNFGETVHRHRWQAS